jgi:DNA polymerase-3 subunit epsilon
MVPFDAQTQKMATHLADHFYLQCPSFEELKPKLNPWVIEHNETLIKKAHLQGLNLNDFKLRLQKYFLSPEVKTFFQDQKPVLFGKSLNAIDLPFLNRDLGHQFMRENFSHRVHDLTSVVYHLIDRQLLPPACESGSFLMKHLGFGEVAHTALEDAVNTVKMYFQLLSNFKTSSF